MRNLQTLSANYERVFNEEVDALSKELKTETDPSAISSLEKALNGCIDDRKSILQLTN